MRLSIITINYNNKDGLKRTLESIYALDKNEFEYLVIDGASSDGSVELLKNGTDKIDYWASEPDRGIYHAMNKGIEKAKGEYLLFLNSGDIIIEGTDISKIIEQLTGEDIIYYNIEVADDVLRTKSFILKCPNFLDFGFLANNALPHQATFIKRQRLVKYGGYSENMKIFSDWAFTLDAICKLQLSYKHIDEHFTVFFQDGISSKKENQDILMAEHDEYIKANYLVYERIYKEWDQQTKELHKLRLSRGIDILKKMGFLKWFRVYKK